MSDVDDRWHRPNPKPGESPCREHRLVPTSCHGRGKRWQARWRDDAGRQRKQSFDRRADAERALAAVKADLGRGLYVDPAGGRLTVKLYGERWRAEQLHRDSTAQSVERAFRLHVDPILGHLRLAQVRSGHLRAWVKDRSGDLGPSTLRVVYSYVAAMFARAVTDRLIGISPCVDVRLPEVDHHDHHIPTPEQVHALAAALPPRYQAVPYLAAGCGLRGGEVFGLELPAAVDFLRREVAVHQQLTVISGRKPYLAPPKTKTSRRVVELPEAAGLPLARHLELFPAVGVEVDDETDPRKPVRRPARLVFTNDRSQPIHSASWSHIWAPAVKAAGLPARFGLHGLRHYFATALIHAGASVKTVQLALGHSTPTVTLNTYVEEWPEAVDRTRAIIDGALGVPRMCPEEEAGR
jgi:integrase